MKMQFYINLLIAVLGLFTACRPDTYTEFTVTVTHPDPSVDGKKVAIVVSLWNMRNPQATIWDNFNGNTVENQVRIPDKFFVNSSEDITITAYFFDSPEDKNIDLPVYKSIPSAFDEYIPFTEKHGNPKNIIEQSFLLYQTEGQNFHLEFPGSLNIQVDYKGYPPLVSWDKLLEFDAMTILVKDKYNKYPSDMHIGSTLWIAAEDTAYPSFTDMSPDRYTVTVYATFFRFREGFVAPGYILNPNVVPGDIFKIEVRSRDVIANSGRNYYRYYVDSLTVLVKQEEIP